MKWSVHHFQMICHVLGRFGLWALQRKWRPGDSWHSGVAAPGKQIMRFSSSRGEATVRRSTFFIISDDMGWPAASFLLCICIALGQSKVITTLRRPFWQWQVYKINDHWSFNQSQLDAFVSALNRTTSDRWSYHWGGVMTGIRWAKQGHINQSEIDLYVSLWDLQMFQCVKLMLSCPQHYTSLTSAAWIKAMAQEEEVYTWVTAKQTLPATDFGQLLVSSPKVISSNTPYASEQRRDARVYQRVER